AFSLKELETRYGISAGALKILSDQHKDAADAAREETAQVKELQKAWEEPDKIMADFAVKSHAMAMKAMQEERAERANQLKETNAVVIEGLEQQKAIQAEYTDWVLKNTLNEHDYKLAKIKEWESATINAFKGTQEQTAIYAAFVHERAAQQIIDLEK